jgi:anti-sigma factor RsiW
MTKRRNFLPDIELLSAYLDNQLSPHQRAVLEARLRTEPGLTTELDSLQKTRQMLRSLPRLHAPRNFTLSAQTYQKRSPARLPALFGAVSALSSALLIVLVISGLLMGGTIKTASVDKENLAYPVVMEASVPEAEVAMSVQEATPSEEEPAVSLAPPPSDDTSRNVAPTPEATATQLVEELLTLGVAEATTPTADLSATPLPDEVTLPRGTVAGSGEETLPEGASAKAPEATPASAASPLTSTLFRGEMILAGVALLSGLIALFLLLRQRK